MKELIILSWNLTIICSYRDEQKEEAPDKKFDTSNDYEVHTSTYLFLFFKVYYIMPMCKKSFSEFVCRLLI